MSISPEIVHIIRRPDLQPCFQELENPRKRFLQALEATENCIALARKMPPENSQGDWGQWNYSSGRGVGNLYIPLHNNGILTVSLDCGGDVGDDNLQKASFVQALAYWETEEYHYGLIVIPGGLLSEWMKNRNHPQEPILRKFFFYQQVPGGLLSLEEFGSIQTGWFITDNLSSLKGLQISFDDREVPVALDDQLFSQYLRKQQQRQDFNPLDIDPVAR